jgi:hypothetical protein
MEDRLLIGWNNFSHLFESTESIVRGVPHTYKDTKSICGMAHVLGTEAFEVVPAAHILYYIGGSFHFTINKEGPSISVDQQRTHTEHKEHSTPFNIE